MLVEGLLLRLAPGGPVARLQGMNFCLAILAYLLIAAVLGWAILLAFAGKPWLLIAAGLVYLVAFAKFGCLSH
jgi:hypothetical protein